MTTEKVIIVPIMIMYMTRIPIRNAFGKLVLVSVRSKNSLSRDFWRVSYSMNPILCNFDLNLTPRREVVPEGTGDYFPFAIFSNLQ